MASDQERPRRAAGGFADSPAPRRGFVKSLFGTIASAVLPGSGLLLTGRPAARGIGLLMSLIALVSGGLIAWTAASDFAGFASFAVSPGLMRSLSILLAGVAVVWVALIVGTHILLRPRSVRPGQRAAGAILVSVLSLVIATPLAVASRYATDQAALIGGIFGEGDSVKSVTTPKLVGRDSAEVWANKPRLNVLLLGSDTSQDRRDTIRARAEGAMLTDTIIVASIDTKTGNVALIQVPRNMAKAPFPHDSPMRKHFPRGFYDGHDGENEEFMVNALWNTVDQEYADEYPNSKYPGADALKESVGEALGLDIDYFLLVDLDGMQQLIDAVGGITVNVNERLAIGGSSDGAKKVYGYIEPGPNQTLDGWDGLWYARSRSNTDDYSRMTRQACTVKAIIQKAEPLNLLQRFEAIASAGKQMVMTDIPQEVLPHFVDLALRVKDGLMNRVAFVTRQDGYVSWDPDFDLMRERVAEAIANPDGKKVETPSDGAGESPKKNDSTGGSSGTSGANNSDGSNGSNSSGGSNSSDGGSAGNSNGGSGDTTPRADDVSDTCGYHPK